MSEAPLDTSSVKKHVDLLDEATELLTLSEKPFQVFVKTVRGPTITLNDITPKTTIDTIMAKIEEREGIPVDAQRLVYASKELRRGKTAGDFGITRDATLFSLLRLRGGVGELSAVQSTLDRGFRRGNVTKSIIASGGESQVMLGYGRELNGLFRAPKPADYPDKKKLKRAQERYEAKRKRHEEFQDKLRLTVEKSLGEEFDDDEAWRAWLKDKKRYVDRLVNEATEAANCGEFSALVFAHLCENTKNQWAYRLSMDGTPTGTHYDHALCCTYPKEHKGRTVKGMNLKVATVADGWHNYLVISVEQFLKKANNAYGDDLIPENLKITARAECTGEPGLDAELGEAIFDMVKDEVSDFESSPEFDRSAQGAQYWAKKKLEWLEYQPDWIREAEKLMADGSLDPYPGEGHPDEKDWFTDAEKLIGRPFENPKSDPSPSQFDIEPTDDVTDKRTTAQVAEKISELFTLRPPAALAEYLDLTPRHAVDLFLQPAPPDWAAITLKSTKATEKLFESLTEVGASKLTAVASKLSDELLGEYFASTAEAATLILDNDGLARTRIYGLLDQLDEDDGLDLCRWMSKGQWDDYRAYLTGKDDEFIEKALAAREKQSISDQIDEIRTGGSAKAFWVLTKKTFERESGGKKPAQRYWFGMRKGSGIEGALKAFDGARTEKAAGKALGSYKTSMTTFVGLWNDAIDSIPDLNKDDILNAYRAMRVTILALNRYLEEALNEYEDLSGPVLPTLFDDVRGL